MHAGALSRITLSVNNENETKPNVKAAVYSGPQAELLEGKSIRQTQQGSWMRSIPTENLHDAIRSIKQCSERDDK